MYTEYSVKPSHYKDMKVQRMKDKDMKDINYKFNHKKNFV